MTSSAATASSRIAYRYAKIDGLNIFYREAGPADAPTIVLLHGFPSSSHMYRNLIPALAEKYHVIAPDYRGFGYSDAPSAETFQYTFDHLADIVDHFLDQKGITKYSIYIQDYGSPVGFRLATRHPERIQAIVSQNGNAYEEGLSPFWAEFLYPFWKERTAETEAKAASLLGLDMTKLQYQAGFRSSEASAPTPGPWTRPDSTARETRPFNSTSSMTTARIRRSTRRGTSIFEPSGRRCSPSGERTTRSSFLPALQPSREMSRRRSSTSLTPATSLLRKTAPRLRH